MPTRPRSRRPTASSRASTTPTRTPGTRGSEKRFKDIGEANAVLSDPKQRQEYDAIRQMAHGGARFRAGGPGGNGGFEDVFSAFGGGDGSRVRFSTGGPGGAGAGQPDLDDLLAQMFGGAARRRPGRAWRRRPVLRLRRTARPAAGRRRAGPHHAELPRCRRGRHGHPADGRGPPDHDQGARGRQGRPEDPAARQGCRGRPRRRQGRPHPHRGGRQAPGVRPRRRQPHRRPAGHLRRGGARRHRRRCRPSTAPRCASRWRRARRAGGCCGSRATASRAGTAPATCSPG